MRKPVAAVVLPHSARIVVLCNDGAGFLYVPGPVGAGINGEWKELPPIPGSKQGDWANGEVNP